VDLIKYSRAISGIKCLNGKYTNVSQFTDDKKDGSQNVGLFTIKPPDTAARLRIFH
jgi:hypothetical protein